jgi:hypothetical protein
VYPMGQILRTVPAEHACTIFRDDFRC